MMTHPEMMARARRALVAWLVASLFVLSAGAHGALAQADTDWALLDGPGAGILHLWTTANGVVFAADSSHGFFRSADAGDTWQAVAGPPDGWPVMPDPTDPLTMYGASADGLYKSSDAAASWTLIVHSTRPLQDFPVQHLAISAADHNVLYLAGPVGEAQQWTLGPQHLPICCTATQIARSQDGGRSWVPVTTLSPSSFCQDWVELLLPHPTDPQRVFSNQGCYAGRDLGGRLSESADGGTTWSTLFRSGQEQDPQVLVGGGGANSSRLYLTTSQFLGQGPARVYRSDDGGTTWALVLEAGDPRSVRFGGLAYNPDEPDEVFVAMGATPNPDDTGVRVSEDGGTTWATLGRPDLGWVNDLARLPDGTLLAATNEGIWRYAPALATS